MRADGVLKVGLEGVRAVGAKGVGGADSQCHSGRSVDDAGNGDGVDGLADRGGNVGQEVIVVGHEGSGISVEDNRSSEVEGADAGSSRDGVATDAAEARSGGADAGYARGNTSLAGDRLVDNVVPGSDVDEQRRSGRSGDHGCGQQSDVHRHASEAGVEVEAVAASSAAGLANVVVEVGSIGAGRADSSVGGVASGAVGVGIAGHAPLRSAISEQVVAEGTDSAV